MPMPEPTAEDVRRARATFVRELEEWRRLVHDKIARQALEEAMTAVDQLVDRIRAEFILQDALDDAEASRSAPAAYRAPGWQHRN